MMTMGMMMTMPTTMMMIIYLFLDPIGWTTRRVQSIYP